MVKSEYAEPGQGTPGTFNFQFSEKRTEQNIIFLEAGPKNLCEQHSILLSH